MTKTEVLAEITRLGIRMERNGDKLRVTARPGTVTTELRQALADYKTELLAELESGAPHRFWHGHVLEAGVKFIFDDEFRARMVNHIFDTQGTSKWPSRIKAETFQHGRDARSEGRRAQRRTEGISTPIKI